MTTARCERCQQLLRPVGDGLACGCQAMPAEAIAVLLAALERVPETWPLLDLLDVVEDLRHDGSLHS